MVANLDKIEWDGGQITNIQRIGFRKGLHKLSFGLGYSDQVRMAHRDFAPRVGLYAQHAVYVQPRERAFSDLISFFGQAYLPRPGRPQLAESGGHLPDFGRRLQVPRRAMRP